MEPTKLGGAAAREWPTSLPTTDMKDNGTAANKSTHRVANTDESTANHSGRDGSTGLQRVCENRNALEDLADSDLACAWIADALLDAADGDSDTVDGGGTDR